MSREGSLIVLHGANRKDEMERVKSYGARVMTLEQLDGLKVAPGPCRIPSQ